MNGGMHVHTNISHGTGRGEAFRCNPREPRRGHVHYVREPLAVTALTPPPQPIAAAERAPLLDVGHDGVSDFHWHLHRKNIRGAG